MLRSKPGSFESLCNVTAIRKASRRVTQFYDATLEPCGLRSTQLAILSHVLGRPGEKATPMTMGQLASALVIDRSALGHNVRPLIRDGFLRLEPSETDRRQTIVAITPLGRAKSREAQKLWERAQSKFEAAFGKSAAGRLRKTMLEIAYSDALEIP